MSSSTTASPFRRLGAVLLALCVLVVAGCDGLGADTPEELFAQVQRLNGERAWQRIWELYTPEARGRQAAAWAEYKEFLRKNPAQINVDRCRRQYGLSPEEFEALEPFQIFALDCDRTAVYVNMQTARIDSVEPAPDVPNAVRVMWSLHDGTKCQMLATQIDGRWRLITMRE